MAFGVDTWSERISAATDDGARRALLAEVGLWRAGKLTDIGAARQGTFALSRLHWLLRERDAAVREARQLLSLCQTPPRASAEDLDAAKGWLASLGEEVPKIAKAPAPREPRGERPQRPAREPREPREPRGATAEGGAVDRAIDAGRQGRFGDGIKALKGKQGRRPELTRLWLQLSRALAHDDPAVSRLDLEQIRDRLLQDVVADGGAPAPAEKPAKEPQARAEKPPREERPPKPEAPAGPTPQQLARERSDALRGLLLADPPGDVDAVVPALEGWGRLWRAIQAAERWGLSDAQAEVLLRAVDRAAEDGDPIPGGTSLAIRVGAAGGARTAALLTEGSTAARYGGPGIDVVLALAAAAAGGGWEVDRVLRGPTRKEVERHPVLGTVAGALDGLWRVLVRRGEQRAELWYVASLPAEGRAGVPMLLLDPHPRVVVLPIDPDLLGWYGSLGGPDAIGWTGEERDAVVQALGSLG